MKNHLLKNLLAATVIIFTVGISGAWAEEIEFKKNPNNLPLCQGRDLTKWNNCYGDGRDNSAAISYVGEWVNGTMHGKGKFIFRENHIYIGEWREGKINGIGVMYYPGNRIEVGEFKLGHLNGFGIQFQKNSKLEGMWEEGKFTRDIYFEKFFQNNEKNNLIIEYLITDIQDVRKDSMSVNLYEKNIMQNINKLPICSKNIIFYTKWDKCFGEREKENKEKYIGEWRDDKFHGLGIYTFGDGFTTYSGEFKEGKFEGNGIFSSGRQKVYGTWMRGNPVKTEPIGDQNSRKIYINLNLEKELNLVPRIIAALENKNKKENSISSLSLKVDHSNTSAEGDFVINIQTGTDTASLKINDEEQGGRADGNYIVKKVARAGQETKFTIVAKDTNGNTDSKTFSVTRQVTASSQIKYAELNPALVKTQSNKDAVAIIIGIAEYKYLPRADYANDDARVFYDYAIRGLGIKPENIKLLVDADAGQGEILKAFKTWLPARVKATTDVYVYYSGHGLPSADGQALYILPQQADRDLIEDTAVAQNRINAALQAAKPKSVTIFLDSCYSGAARTGQALLASARPISLKANTQTFPPDFTVFTASTADQISSSSNELKHGIFSYYLMRGMEGEADTNKDGKITTGEMHSYLLDNVARQASLANRVQQPQLAGDANRVLVGR